MPHPLHHIHRRKNSPGYYASFLDKVVLTAGIAMPILTLPQVYEIWIRKSVEGVSLFTWSAYLIAAIIFSVYGFVHKAVPVIILHTSMAVLEVFIVLGLIIYK